MFFFFPILYQKGDIDQPAAVENLHENRYRDCLRWLFDDVGVNVKECIQEWIDFPRTEKRIVDPINYAARFSNLWNH